VFDFSTRTHILLALTLPSIVLSVAAATASTHGAVPPAHVAVDATDMDLLEHRNLAIPVQGVKAKELRDNFEEGRGKRRHDAIDILAPRGTPVLAVGDGRIAKLFTSAAGGLTIYQFDADERFTYYYAHLDRYAEGIKAGMPVKRGDVIGYVGTTGNAPKNTPHLHFAIFRLGPEKQWWKGIALNPYPVLARQ